MRKCADDRLASAMVLAPFPPLPCNSYNIQMAAKQRDTLMACVDGWNVRRQCDSLTDCQTLRQLERNSNENGMEKKQNEENRNHGYVRRDRCARK